MAGVHVRMPDAAQDGKVVPEITEVLQVGRELIILPGLASLREELMRQNSQVIADSEKPPWNRRLRRSFRECGNHRIQKRKAEEDARPLKERAPGNGPLGGDVNGFHRFICS